MPVIYSTLENALSAPRVSSAVVVRLCLGAQLHVWLLVTPWTVAHQAPPSREFSRAEYWSGLPCPPARDLPNAGIKPRSPALQADSLPPAPPGKRLYSCLVVYCKMWIIWTFFEVFSNSFILADFLSIHPTTCW